MLDDMMPLSETMVGSGPAEGDRPQDPTEPVGAPEISGSGVSVANATEADAATATSDPPELDEFGLVGPEISKVSVGSGDAGERNGATRKPSDIGMYEHRSLRSRITAVLHEEEADADDVGTNDLPESPDGDSYGEGAYRLVSDLRRQMDEPEETEVSTLRRLITAITRL
jgi:hypothetical protein